MSAPNEASRAQVQAARPDSSTWVAANAGSGKTRVLTDRVARLLLRGTDPRRILCLTFTKAAAGEMQNRLFARLGEWAMLDDATLRDRLDALGEGADLGAPGLAEARTLFARALETPGGLKIQTIHAFCEALLRRFPLEAGVPAGFAVMDERAAAQFRLGLLEALAAEPESGFVELAAQLSGLEARADGLLTAILRHRDRFGVAPNDPAVERAFGLNPGAAIPDPLDGIDAARLDRIIPDLIDVGGKTNIEAATALLAMRKTEGAARIEASVGGLLTGRYEVRKTLCTKAAEAHHPGATEILSRIAQAAEAAVEVTRARRAIDATRALLRFGRRFLAAAEARKRADGVLDFDDLIDRAAALLTEASAADWVRYRLDGGIDHVLVDEAQDTSPAQWAVIDAITQEFFAGAGARGGQRTVFVVGDEKQSIYSFQGADPRAFGTQRDRFATALDGVGAVLSTVPLTHSFRSAPPILDLVDRVFADQPPNTGGGEGHQPFHRDRPGLVEVWPFRISEAAAEDAPWYLPLDQASADNPDLVLGAEIAERIAAILADPAPLPGLARRARPGDVLVLVRRRGRLFRRIISTLKMRGVPVAGADRLKVAEELAVRDLLSLLRAVVSADDDLSLAEGLRSPIMGLSEGALFRLAHGREGTLATALEAAAADHPDAWAIYKDLRDRSDFLRPFELLQRVLVRHGAGARIAARLGPEAVEAVEALLDLALDYERAEAPSLLGFLDWMASGDPELKRQLDPDAGEVRVMTVHGAKGLEAPIVILPDTAKRRPSTPPVLHPIGADLIVPNGKADERPAVLRAAEADRQAREREEALRLLYVALTRAERWLIVAGAGRAAKDGEDESWYGAIAAGLNRLGALPDDDGIRRLRFRWDVPDAAAEPPATPAEPRPAPSYEPVLAPPRPPQPLRPSRDGADWAAQQGYGAAPAPMGAAPIPAEEARQRGILLHRLLEDGAGSIPPADAVPDSGLPAETVADLARQAAALRANPALAWIFGPESLAEVPILGRVAAFDGQAIRGQIDRLVLAPDAVTAIDFKSDANPPPAGAALSAAYAGQLALYCLALKEVFPDRAIRAGVLWTAIARFDPFDHETVMAIGPNHGPH